MRRGNLGKAALQTYGAYLQQYHRIGGALTYSPPVLSIVQTDGSHTSRQSRVAMILTSRDEMSMYKKMIPIRAENSTETEWASVAAGVEFAIQKGESYIGIENDNLGVVGALITDKRDFGRSTYAYYYRDKILKSAGLTLWTGIRWIPREINRADDLFHQKNIETDE
jgi:hypothetical protein